VPTLKTLILLGNMKISGPNHCCFLSSWNKKARAVMGLKIPPKALPGDADN
jgi:hypothetical protein